jgi:hypothetical protein
MTSWRKRTLVRMSDQDQTKQSGADALRIEEGKALGVKPIMQVAPDSAPGIPNVPPAPTNHVAPVDTSGSEAPPAAPSSPPDQNDA